MGFRAAAMQTPRTIRATRQAILNGETTAVALAEHYYQAIDAEDPKINAWLSLSRDRAMAQAARIDGMLANGEQLPALAGVPIGIKDVLTMQGAPATAGSKILEGYLPPYDATVVARLEAAGAVLLGKLNCDEFAMGSSNENSAYGPVHNPRALDRVPGGSSGGFIANIWSSVALWLDRVCVVARSRWAVYTYCRRRGDPFRGSGRP
jgi:aspartyl-tRNA(Asn)/glutamyl-tRNA(Gln) amidotransferase subunit A